MKIIKWKFKKNAIKQGSHDGFWYDVMEKGYFTPDRFLTDAKQIKKIETALRIVSSYEFALAANDLIKY